MARASKSEEFNLVGSWSRNAIYTGSNWSWADAEGEEDELVEEINSTFGSPDFLIAIRVEGTGEPVPLSMLTIDQLCEVVRTNPANEKKAILVSAEDRRFFEEMEKETREKSAENIPNSTGNLVEWIFSKIVIAVARGMIRFVTAMESRGTRFFILPKRNIWMRKGGRVEEATSIAEKERENLEEAEMTKKRKLGDLEEGALSTDNRARPTLLIEDSDDEEVKDFWRSSQEATGRDRQEKDRINLEVSELFIALIDPYSKFRALLSFPFSF